MSAPKDIMRIQEAAEYLSVSVGTLYHWVSEGRIPVVRISARCIRFRRADLDGWLESKMASIPGGQRR